MIRAASPLEYLGFMGRNIITTVRRAQTRRDTKAVEDEYEAGWSSYVPLLNKANSVDDWLTIEGLENVPGVYNVDGQLAVGRFNSAAFYRQSLLSAIKQYFPAARSFTEYGCGVGRNLIAVTRAIPGATCFGYELCAPGVEVARAAAAKFGLDIKYSQLNYVDDPKEKYVFPQTDVAFTMFSLEQLPSHCDVALRNILASARMGSIHIEPVPENYPCSPRGLLGRLEHRKVDYLGGFDATARATANVTVTVEQLRSAHNPLMFPSLYVLRK